MSSRDKNLVIVYNGEIYNYLELKEELKALGHNFTTSSDTEVILAAYAQWGFDCQNKFNGMWAFALWDARAQHLFLSRDRIGEKPLHFRCVTTRSYLAPRSKACLLQGTPMKRRTTCGISIFRSDIFRHLIPSIQESPS